MAEDEDQFIVRCFQPSARSVTSHMKSAVHMMKQHDYHLVWMTETEMLELGTKQKKNVFIFDKFEGQAFEHIKSLGCRIYGPMCILTSLKSNKPLPNAKVPIFNNAMGDLVVCCSSLEKDVRPKIMQLAQSMGASVQGSFDDSVTHLVAGEVGSKKYMVACELGKKIMSPEWIYKVWKRSQEAFVRATDDEFDQYKCPLFKGLTFTVSGNFPIARPEVISMIEHEGGRYSGEMKIKECTHLVINEPKGQKYEFGKKWQIKIVTLQWLIDCMEKGCCIPEEPYHPNTYRESDDNNTSKGKVKTSTPTRMSSVGGMSISDVSCISVTHINETANATMNMSTRVEEKDALDQLDITVQAGKGFLDGCQIFVGGFSGQKLDKIRKLINIGGGTRFSHLNESVSHVVVPSCAESLIQQIKESKLSPFVVRVEWLTDSYQSGQCMPEEDYILADLGATSASPKAKHSTKRLSRASKNDSVIEMKPPRAKPAQQPEQPSPAKSTHEDMQELMSQYMNTNCGTTLGDDSALMRAAEQASLQQQLTAAADVTLQGPAPAVDDDATQDPDSTEPEDGDPQIFKNKIFVVLGFDHEVENTIIKIIRQTGGAVVQAGSRQVADYAIVPLFGLEVKMTASEVVTDTWLQACINEEKLKTVGDNELFTPLPNVPNAQPLKGTVMSLSGFPGVEKEALAHIAESLGAVVQDSFLRKKARGMEACTHLLVKVPEACSGPKCTAACKWKIPAVTKYWLFECAKEGKHVSEEDYLASNPENHKPKPKIQPANTVEEVVVPPTTKETPKEYKPNRSVSASVATSTTPTVRRGRSSGRLSLASKKKSPVAVVIPQSVTSKGRPELVNAEVQEESHSNTTAENAGAEITCENDADSRTRLELGTEGGAAEDLEDDSTVIEGQVDLNRSDKENEGTQSGSRSQAVNQPLKNTPLHNRVKELVAGENQPQKAPGVDSPWRFLTKGLKYQPSFELDNCLAELKSPELQGSQKGRRRKSSLPLEDLMSLHLRKALGEKEEDETKIEEPKPEPSKTIAAANWLNISISNQKTKTPAKGMTTRSKGTTPSRRSSRLRKQPDTEMGPPSPRLAPAVEGDENAQDVPQSLEVKEALTMQLGNIMAATKVQKPKQRNSRRLNSSNSYLSGDAETSGSRPSSRQRNRDKDDLTCSPAAMRNTRSNSNSSTSLTKPEAADVMPEASQSVRVTWDDPLDRLQQEQLAEEMNHGSESSESQGQEPQSSKQSGITIQNALMEREAPSSEVSNDKPASPEPPSITMPLPKRSSVVEAPQPVELLEEEDPEEKKELEQEPPVFLLSSLSQQERIDYAALIEELGGTVCEANFYEDGCSHLIVGNPSRQEKYLACVAAGKWVLHKSYLEECRRQGKFVEEEAHEWGSEATSRILASASEGNVKLAHAAHRWRVHVANLRKNPSASKKVRGAFEGWQVVLITNEKRVDGFRRMLEAGGAVVVATRPPFTDLSSVTHAFMDLQKVDIQVNLAEFLQAGVHCLRPEYLVSYLTDDPSPEEQTFYIPEVKAALSSSTEDVRKRKSSGSSDSSTSKRTRIR